MHIADVLWILVEWRIKRTKLRLTSEVTRILREEDHQAFTKGTPP